MKKLLLSLVTTIATGGISSAAIFFHSDFDEASLGAIAGLNIDTPNTVGANSGTVNLNTGANTLDFTANRADMWGGRDGAPIAWVAAPSVTVGTTWSVETQITMANSIGTNSATYDQVGMTFYGGPNGASPGSDDSFILGINDWSNTWTAIVQGLGDNNPLSTVALNPTDTNIFFRTEITEGGVTDIYNFYFKENVGDAWTQIGGSALNYANDVNNSRVGLFLKSHNNNPNASAQFNFLTVTVPEPSTSSLVALAGVAIFFRRSRK